MMPLHEHGCECFYCREDREFEKRVKEAELRDKEAAEQEAEVYDPEPGEWDDDPTRVADVLAEVVAAAEPSAEPVEEFKGEDTAKHETFPELAHMVETSSKDAVALALGAIVDAMIEDGIEHVRASKIMARGLALMIDRKARRDRIPNPKPSVV